MVSWMISADPARRGLFAILFATGFAGLMGYVIQILAPLSLDSATSYVAFTVYWSTLFLLVQALSGVQQEVTRAAHPIAGEGGGPPTLRNATAVLLVVVTAAVMILTVLFGHLVFGDDALVFGIGIAAGLVGFLLTAVLAGVFYGLHRWRAVAAMTIVDAATRAILVSAGFALELDAGWIALLVSAPFGLAFAAAWLVWRGSVVGAFELDVGWRRLAANTLGTVGASTATGVLITGLPLLLQLTSADSTPEQVAALVLALTIIRAPVVIPPLAFQSYLTTVLRARRDDLGRPIALAAAVAIAAAAALTGLAAWLGPSVVGLVSEQRFSISASMCAAIVASGGIVALMCVTGPALLVRSQHTIYAAGWIAAAVATLALLAVPTISFDNRVALSLLVSPAVGLAVHVAGMLRVRH